jgi:hypothetical protein
MHLSQGFVLTGLTIGVLIAASSGVPAILQAQSSGISGPILGFIPDGAGTSIRPILGIPGASILGNRLPLDVDIRGAVLSPKQDYAIAARGEDAQVIMIDLADSATVVRPLPISHPGADLIAVSPTGSAAAVYCHESKTVHVIGRLPQAPELISEFDASSIDGQAMSLAVNDDGTIALVKFVDATGPGLWVLASSGGPWRVSLDRPSAAAFFPNRRDAIVTDDATRSVFLILDVDRAAIRVPLIYADENVTGFSSISASEDGRRVFLADAGSGQITIVDVETRTTVQASCQCRLAGLHRLNGTAIFRLSEPSLEPVMVLDASSDPPRIVVIPPDVSVAAQPR